MYTTHGADRVSQTGRHANQLITPHIVLYKSTIDPNLWTPKTPPVQAISRSYS